MNKIKRVTKKEITEFKKQLGKKIQLLRKEKNLSQQELSEIVGMSTTSLGFIEVGRSQPKVENLINISRALEIEPYTLFLNDKNCLEHYVSATSDKKASLASEKVERANERIKIAIRAANKLVNDLQGVLKKGI